MGIRDTTRNISRVGIGVRVRARLRHGSPSIQLNEDRIRADLRCPAHTLPHNTQHRIVRIGAHRRSRPLLQIQM